MKTTKPVKLKEKYGVIILFPVKRAVTNYRTNYSPLKPSDSNNILVLLALGVLSRVVNVADSHSHSQLVHLTGSPGGHLGLHQHSQDGQLAVEGGKDLGRAASAIIMRTIH